MNISFLPFSLYLINDPHSDVIHAFISSLLVACREPGSLIAWKKAHESLQFVNNQPKGEEMEKSILIHYLNKCITYLSCDHIYVQEKAILLKQLGKLLDNLNKHITNDISLNERQIEKPASYHKTFQGI